MQDASSDLAVALIAASAGLGGVIVGGLITLAADLVIFGKRSAREDQLAAERREQEQADALASALGSARGRARSALVALTSCARQTDTGEARVHIVRWAGDTTVDAVSSLERLAVAGGADTTEQARRIARELEDVYRIAAQHDATGEDRRDALKRVGELDGPLTNLGVRVGD
jgi:hypothetical protein